MDLYARKVELHVETVICASRVSGREKTQAGFPEAQGSHPRKGGLPPGRIGQVLRPFESGNGVSSHALPVAVRKDPPQEV